MKRIYTIAIILFTFYLFAGITVERKDVAWRSDYISGVYSEKLEQPLMVEYVVLCTEGDVNRDGMQFYEDAKIHTSDDADYVSNVWDKGHLAPAADYKCDREAMLATFTYLNCALQHENLNRGVWKSLEAHERELSKEHDLRIFVHVDFAAKPNRVAAGAAIPTGFYKEILVFSNNDSIKSTRECYWFPNKRPDSKQYEDYECECRN